MPDEQKPDVKTSKPKLPMICPIREDQSCQRSKCAWWMPSEKHCAVWEIAFCLHYIEEAIDKMEV